MSDSPSQVEDGDLSFDYPNFSPPQDASGLIPITLPEPLISLPPAIPEQHNSFSHALLSQPTLQPASDPCAYTPNSMSTQALKLQQLETLCRDLQREKNVMEDQFGQQRKKFMNLMIQKDTELSTVRKSVEQYSIQARQLSQQLMLREEEIRSVAAASKATESANREAFDADRIKYEEEIANLRKIIEVDRSQREKEVLLQSKEQSSRLCSPTPGDPSLDTAMVMAVQQSKMLKSVVVPLEKEIVHLRQQLNEAKERIRHAELSPQAHTPPLIDLGTTLPLTSPPTGGQLQQQLELERAARHDLEMHTRTLEQEKALLQEEAYSLKKEKLRDEVKEGRRQSPTRLTGRSHSLGDIQDRRVSKDLETVALEVELKRVRLRLQLQTTTCESYEAQLQRVQEQMLEELEEKDQELSRLREENSKARAGVGRERKAAEELRRKMEEACQKFKAQVERFEATMQNQQAKLKSLKEQYTQSKHEAQRDLARFSDERVSLFAQITSAQEEYDCLKVVQSEEAQKYTQDITEANKALAMAEENVAALQTRLTELEQEKLKSEESLGSQLAQLNELYQLEQITREKNEFALSKQLDAARSQILALEMIKEELGQEQQMKEEAMAACSDLEEKSRSFIAEQHHKLEAEVAARQAAEQQVRELQMQMGSLRLQLNTSQANQKDFVELSQALQVKLARIEEEQSATSPTHPP